MLFFEATPFNRRFCTNFRSLHYSWNWQGCILLHRDPVKCDCVVYLISKCANTTGLFYKWTLLPLFLYSLRNAWSIQIALELHTKIIQNKCPRCINSPVLIHVWWSICGEKWIEIAQTVMSNYTLVLHVGKSKIQLPKRYRKSGRKATYTTSVGIGGQHVRGRYITCRKEYDTVFFVKVSNSRITRNGL
jgi:hypothetical protein